MTVLLNGHTEPLLNIIAGTFLRRYKIKMDKHFAAYIGSAITIG